MFVTAFAIFFAVSAATPSTLQTARSDCTEWHDCRQQALAAAENHDYERFHDLAWRTVQTGPRNDPALMLLLARAQALSGRAHDALIMLQRLAAIGQAADAISNDDFSRTRELPGWPEVEAQILGSRREAPSATAAAVVPVPAPVTVPAPAPAPAPAPNVPPPPATTLEPKTSRAPAALPAAGFHVSADRFALSGFAYDALSQRFVLGDRTGRKLIVVDERSKQTMDLVRAESAGFLDIAAVEIDAKRGDLWVASVGTDDGAGTLHKLQLASGRHLRTFQIASEFQPVKLVDLGVDGTGTVVVLDSEAPQLFVLRPGATALERAVKIDATAPVSLALRRDDGMAMVAHRDGLTRVDLRSRSASPVTAAKGIDLRHLERIRWHGNALIGVQVDDDGSRRIVRMELNGRGNVTRATRLEVPGPTASQTFSMTISGDELIYVASEAADSSARSSSNGSAHDREFVAQRVPLR